MNKFQSASVARSACSPTTYSNLQPNRLLICRIASFSHEVKESISACPGGPAHLRHALEHSFTQTLALVVVTHNEAPFHVLWVIQPYDLADSNDLVLVSFFISHKSHERKLAIVGNSA